MCTLLRSYVDQIPHHVLENSSIQSCGGLFSSELNHLEHFDVYNYICMCIQTVHVYNNII